jgi:RNA-directed DNA polymerase
VLKARGYQRDGKCGAVDMDLKAFFDEVDHDILMGRVRRKVKDRRVNRLINLYLKAGVLTSDGEDATEKGTPQGGPLSPLLSNILLETLQRNRTA